MGTEWRNWNDMLSESSRLLFMHMWDVIDALVSFLFSGCSETTHARFEYRYFFWPTKWCDEYRHGCDVNDQCTSIYKLIIVCEFGTVSNYFIYSLAQLYF